MASIAVLGMGNMGRAIATRLLDAGHDVAVWNRTAGQDGDVVAAGARRTRGVADAARGADVVITMLANDDAVRAVALGELRSSIGDHAVYVDSSTVSPPLSAELATAFPGRFVALPVLGSPEAVRSGNAVFLAGADAAVVERIGAVLSSLSPTVRRYDTALLAITAKLTNNMLLLSELVGLAEAFAVGRSGGLSDAQLRQLLGDSPMVAPGIRNRFEGILTGPQEGWWATALGAKDAGLAIDLARRSDIELPEAAAVKAVFEQAATAGLEHADVAAVGRLYV
jgi:3-hydroxyisobutyrate dehydrogenase